MPHQPFRMFKSNPFQEEFQKYQGRAIRTLPIKHFSFLNPSQTPHGSRPNKINLKNSDHKDSHFPDQSHLIKIFPDKKDPKQFAKKFHITNPNNKTNKPINYTQKSPKHLINITTKSKKDALTLNQKLTESYKINQIKSMSLTARDKKTDITLNDRYSGSNTISYDKNRAQIKLKQKLYQSIDFDNLFEKVESQVSQMERRESPQKSPKTKDRLMLLDKMKRYSKTPTSKGRNVFDQFNLKYLINKRKNFNLKNESNIKGSHLPYFQSFNSSQMRQLTKAQRTDEANNSLEKISRRAPELSAEQGESRRKMSSFIVIDDHGIVHEENPECKDRDEMMKKISGKLVSIRQLLKIERIDPVTAR